MSLQEAIFVHEKRRLLRPAAPLDALTIVRHVAATVITTAPKIIAAAFAIGLVSKKLARDLKPTGLKKRFLARRICCEKNRPAGGPRHSDLHAAKTVTMAQSASSAEAVELFTMDFNSSRDHLLNRWIREMFMREAHCDTAYVVEPLDLIRAKMCIQRA